MKLEGDPEAIEALKALKEERPDFLKFLLSEVRTNTTRSASFKTADGVEYIVKFLPATGNIQVERAGGG